ncbi:MAG TPA: hypothetical protein VGB67_09430, partial [Fibrella sp.]
PHRGYVGEFVRVGALRKYPYYKVTKTAKVNPVMLLFPQLVMYKAKAEKVVQKSTVSWLYFLVRQTSDKEEAGRIYLSAYIAV